MATSYGRYRSSASTTSTINRPSSSSSSPSPPPHLVHLSYQPQPSHSLSFPSSSVAPPAYSSSSLSSSSSPSSSSSSSSSFSSYSSFSPSVSSSSPSATSFFSSSFSSSPSSSCSSSHSYAFDPPMDFAYFFHFVSTSFSSSLLPLRLSLLFFFFAYLLLFSFRTHLILLFLSCSCACASYSLYAYIHQQGLLSFVPGSIRDYFTRYSLLEISQMEWDSRAFKALVALFCFKLSEEEILMVLTKLPKEMREMMMKKGIVHLLPNEMGKFMIPKERKRRRREEGSEEEGEVWEGGENEEEIDEEEEKRKEEAEQEREEAGLRQQVGTEEKLDEETVLLANIERQLAVSRSSSSPSLASLVPPFASSSSSSSAASSSSSPSSSIIPSSPDDPVSLFRLSDRALSSSFNLFFQHASEQFLVAVQQWWFDRISTALTPTSITSSHLRLFVPLASVVGVVHFLPVANREKLKQVTITAMKIGIDVGAIAAALAAVYQVGKVMSGKGDKEREKLLKEEERKRGLSLLHQRLSFLHSLPQHRSSSTACTSSSRFLFSRSYVLFMWEKLKREKSLWLSGFVLAMWMAYLAQGRRQIMNLK